MAEWIADLKVQIDATVAQYNQRIETGVLEDRLLMNWTALIWLNVAYLSTVFFLWHYMKARKEPFQLKWILRVYNLVCVAAAGYVLVGIVYHKIFINAGTLVCNKQDFTPQAWFINSAIHVFYLQKFLEFFDTFFMLLRKSFRQVTFLHVYHHSSISAVVLAYGQFDINGDCFWPVMLNSFVHVLMYLHYFVSSLGLKTPWRSLLTQMQLFQFLLIAGQTAAMFMWDGCGYPHWLKVIMIAYMGTMIALFMNFYLHAYADKGDKKSKGGEKEN